MVGHVVHQARAPDLLALTPQVGISNLAQIPGHKLLDPTIYLGKRTFIKGQIALPGAHHPDESGEAAQQRAPAIPVPVGGDLLGMGKRGGCGGGRHAEAPAHGIGDGALVQVDMAVSPPGPFDLPQVGIRDVAEGNQHGVADHGIAGGPGERRDRFGPALAQVSLRPQVVGLGPGLAEGGPVVVARYGGCHHGGDRVESKEHARDLGRDHLLDHDRQGDLRRVNTPLGAVGNGAGRPQAGPAPANGRQQQFLSHHVQVGLLLPGKTGLGQILGGGGRAHGDGAGQGEIGLSDGLRHTRGDLAPLEQLPDLDRGPLEGGQVAGRRLLAQIGDACLQLVSLHEGPVGGRADHEPGRHREAGTDHLVQVYAFSPGHRQA